MQTLVSHLVPDDAPQKKDVCMDESKEEEDSTRAQDPRQETDAQRAERLMIQELSAEHIFYVVSPHPLTPYRMQYR